MARVTVVLGGQTHELRTPGPYWVRQEVMQKTAVKNQTLGFAAALGLALPPGFLEAVYLDDVIAYGKLVFQELMDKGVAPEEIGPASWTAYKLLRNAHTPKISELQASPQKDPEGNG